MDEREESVIRQDMEKDPTVRQGEERESVCVQKRGYVSFSA